MGSCSENLHDGSNFQDCRFVTHPGEGTPPRAYIVEQFECLLESDPGPGTGGGGSIGGGGFGGGGSQQNPPKGAPTYPCDGSGVSTGPQQPILTDGNGTCSGTPTIPILPNPKDPCERLKSITSKQIFKDNITSLKGKTGESSERGYRMDYQNQTPTNPLGTGTNNQYLQNKPGTDQIDFKYFLPSTYAIMHTHYDGLYDPIFSPGDIIQFNQWLVNAKAWNDNPANTIKIDLTKLTYTLVTSWGNYTLTFDGTDVVPFTNYDLNDLKNKYEKAVQSAMTVGNVSGDVSFNMEDLEEEFLKFAKANLNMPGMKLFKIESSGNTEIFLKPNNNRDTKPCN